ncbi:type VI secretion system tip protein VgrG [Dechloromonas sp. XY25]|uniref:Type VI secretion system tip protein VgrG n=1 Tax=Dechloromonas hankyongensis TaxID=2908002 RepID=A0ABS9K2Y2_9RHOO|nr:type VI secretion system Vgr family protein [Dechloromonas hankyongensis]MCG2577542.1 type VI secretion system tip protein VgrG [Dechloromonas hankyongensis]
MNAILDMITGGAGWRQTDRLLNLITPAGSEALLAETARIDEALGPVSEHAGYRIELTVLSVDAEQSLTALLGQPARLDLQTAASRSVRRPFHGHITQITREGANGGFARYRLIIEPWLAFLGHTRDNYLFQDKSVIEIVDELLADWKGQGKLVPEWQWRLSDPAAYPKRGMTVQYRESDLAFLKRLLAEEGLFCWFEHQAGEGETLGRHTLVIADHNGAFASNSHPRIRFTQAGATLAEDSLDQWHGLRQLDTVETNASSWDYRSLSTRPQGAVSTIDNGALPKTAAWHDPGQYAWQNSAHGERMLANQRQALDARMKQYTGQGTVRSAAPGTTFILADHPEHDLDLPEHRKFLITAVTHEARNNLAEVVNGEASPEQGGERHIDLYRNRIAAIRAAIAWKPVMTDAQGRNIHPRPTASGTLTAIVVGDGSPTHTDRDGRVRVQFPWQRGADAGARHEHPTGSDNAPANQSVGVWVRVMTPVAGANWGGHLVPRPGQEVLVAFQNGNIDRPLIVGTAYNGSGQTDAQGNAIGGGTMQACANAPAFFAGKDAEQHTHHASLSGLKTQQLNTSRSGQGGYNQLAFDDTPGESRIELGTTEYQSALQLGHLKQQTDNAREADRGHGAELKTQASLALRTGNGLLLSADARPNASGTHLDSHEPIAQTQDARSLTQSLAEVAAKQNAALKGDPQADKLPVVEACQQAEAVMSATARQSAGQGSGGDIKATLGGTGTVPAWSEPRIQFAAPAGIAQLTPQNHILASGKNLSISTGHDTNLISQGNHSLVIKDGLALFTVGKAKDKNTPNTDTGIHLHAASGTVGLQSQGGKTMAAADKKVTFASISGKLTVSAKQKILATAQGAYIRIEGGNIELHAPKKVEFKASNKDWTGPKSAAAELPSSPAANKLNLVQSEATERAAYSQRVNVAGLIGGDPESGSLYAAMLYEAYNEQGQKIAAGQLSAEGTTGTISTSKPEKVKVVISQGDWLFFQDVNHR